MNTLRPARPATKNGTHWLRSETVHAWNLRPATAMAVGKGCSENLSGAKAFGCFCNYSETKLRTPAARGQTLLITCPQRHAAGDWRGRVNRP